MPDLKHPHQSNPALVVPLGQPLPPPPNKPKRNKPPPAVHLVAGGLGGMCGSIVTAPFDVVKTRLQSDLFQAKVVDGGKAVTRTGVKGLLWNFVDTGKILRDVYKYEGTPALFKGLGPTLAGAVPARSINFFVYGNGKHVYAELLNNGQENTVVHLASAATAGVATAAATNPIWVVKTVMQLQQQERKHAAAASSSSAAPSPSTASPSSTRPLPTPPKSTQQTFSHSFRSLSSPPLALDTPPRKPTSWSTTVLIFRTQGLKGFYRGLSASLLGVTEGTIQWSLYEQFKRMARVKRPDGVEEEVAWRMSAAAGGAKLVATVITYPHEVVRTRLRQPLPASGIAKYTSLGQCFGLILKEEGWRTFYSGLSPHLMRVIPNAITMFLVYENLVSWAERMNNKHLDEPTLRRD
ncbi:hypothetical protein JCM11251_002627 [Rhodosporidiobolus azoricus]